LIFSGEFELFGTAPANVPEYNELMLFIS
jgi:hypothetical protein